MEINDGEEEEFGFSRNYLLAKDLASSGKKSTHKLSDSDLVDEQVVVTLAEVLLDQFKSKRKTGSRNLPKAQQPFNSLSMEDLLAFLDGSAVKENDCFLCIIIHNIDEPGLRDSETQQFLARIASCSHIRMIASVDHVNASLLAIVLQSLTPNAQSVFKILAEYQLSHSDEEGMPVDNLYATARECFLVSSLVTLNSHFTEFKDHELVKTMRHCDVQDCLYIPIASEALEKLLSEMNQ